MGEAFFDNSSCSTSAPPSTVWLSPSKMVVSRPLHCFMRSPFSIFLSPKRKTAGGNDALGEVVLEGKGPTRKGRRQVCGVPPAAHIFTQAACGNITSVKEGKYINILGIHYRVIFSLIPKLLLPPDASRPDDHCVDWHFSRKLLSSDQAIFDTRMHILWFLRHWRLLSIRSNETWR